MRSHWMTGVVLALAGAACASSQGEKVRDARMEQAEHNADAREKAVEHNESAREDAIERNADQARDNASKPQKELIGVSEDRAKYQSEAQAHLEKLGVRIDEAQQKLNALGARAPLALKSELATTTQQYKTLQRDVNDLSATPPDNWEATTHKVDAGLSSLDKRVSDLADDIKDVS